MVRCVPPTSTPTRVCLDRSRRSFCHSVGVYPAGWERASRFINFSEGGGEPSTQPFQPFFAAERFLRGGADIVRRSSCAVTASPSSGVRGRFDEACEVLDEMEGPGVEAGVEARRRGGDVGDGVTETERCTEGMRIVGRVRQKLLCEPPVVKRIEGRQLAGARQIVLRHRALRVDCLQLLAGARCGP